MYMFIKLNVWSCICIQTNIITKSGMCMCVCAYTYIHTSIYEDIILIGNFFCVVHHCLIPTLYFELSNIKVCDICSFDLCL